MSLKKRMFRSYMMFLFYSLCALFCVTTLAGVSFSGQFSKKFEALQDAQLNVNVMEAAGMMEADYAGTGRDRAWILVPFAMTFLRYKTEGLCMGIIREKGRNFCGIFLWKSTSRAR